MDQISNETHVEVTELPVSLHRFGSECGRCEVLLNRRNLSSVFLHCVDISFHLPPGISSSPPQQLLGPEKRKEPRPPSIYLIVRIMQTSFSFSEWEKL